MNWKSSLPNRRFVLALLLLLLLAVAQSGAECPDPHWQPGEGLRGVDGQIRATILWDRDGPGGQPPLLVVGGSFIVAGSTFATNIAAWNGTSWEQLGGGVSPAAQVSALAVLPNGDLVAAGSFAAAGGSVVNRIARWDGESWSGLEGGMGTAFNTAVYAMAVLPNGDLIAAGSFTTAGGVAATNIARWDGALWSPVGGGLSGVVEELLVEPDGDLIAAGGFTMAGDTPARGIARWNGSTWSPFGEGVLGGITALARLTNGDIVAAGASISPVGGGGNHVLRWNGSAWAGMIEGLSLSPLPSFLAFTILPNGTLIGGGTFGVATAPGGSGVAYWDGGAWVGLDAGIPGFVYSFTVLPDGDLVAGGNFARAGEVTALSLARWDGEAWNPYGSGFAGASQNSIRAFARLPNGDLIAGGTFTSAGQVEAQGLARWDGSSWSALGSWESGSVNALLVLPSGGLLAAGAFRFPGTQIFRSIVQWDGVDWSPLGPPDIGQPPTILTLARLQNGNIVVGGSAISIGGQSIGSIGQWNGSEWSSLGPFSGGSVLALAVLPNGDLIAGGEFSMLGGVTASRIALWNGTTWSALGTGMNGRVQALAVEPNGNLLAGGSFGTAGGVVVSRIARWNGSAWSAFGTGLSPTGSPRVEAITVLTNGDVVIGGAFTRAGTTNTANVARWNGSAWIGLGGSGTSGAFLARASDVFALAALPDGGFVMGGSFVAVNGNMSHCFARWGCPVAPPGPLLTNVVRGDAGFKFSFQGVAGKTYRVEYTQDFLSWLSIQTGLQGFVDFEDTDLERGANAQGYYQVAEE